jgi:hypothetical protein
MESKFAVDYDQATALSADEVVAAFKEMLARYIVDRLPAVQQKTRESTAARDPHEYQPLWLWLLGAVVATGCFLLFRAGG